MNATKWTPGPWVAEQKGTRVLAKDDRITIVCEVTGSVSNKTTTADAALIAAAPELYDALRLLEDVERNCGGLAIFQAAMCKARAALAKARGEGAGATPKTHECDGTDCDCLCGVDTVSGPCLCRDGSKYGKGTR